LDGQGDRLLSPKSANHDPTRPFFLYVANNAVHGPLQAKEADLAKYRGHL